MATLTISNKQARRFILKHQKLWPPYEVEGKAGILDFIRHVGCIQFDPLNIVGHNPELVLQARVDDFRPAMLRELLYEDRKLLDAWDKMMAIYCTEDWPYFHYRQREAAQRSERRNTEAIKEIIPQVRRAIEERGPISSIDLDHDRKVDWAWGPTRLAKVALENMFYTGELIIHHKVHTRRFYDLASRHIPERILTAPDPHKTQEEYHDWHVQRRTMGIGLIWNSHAIYTGIYGAGKESLATINRLIKKGEIREVTVEGIKKPLFMRSIDMAELEQTMSSSDDIKRVAIIAPLDNLLWERELIEQLFDFKYRWEVYKPVVEREYGYYVLPVLYGDRFIARFEPARDKKTGAFIIRNWWWEDNIEKTDEMFNALRDCFDRFLQFLGGEEIQVDKALIKRRGLDWL